MNRVHPSPSPLDAALRSLLIAQRARNRPAQADACVALMHGVRALDGTCRRCGVPSADLDDVRQELLLKIVRSLQTLHGDLRAPQAWARHVARAVAIDWMRREGRAHREDIDPDSIAAPLEDTELEADHAALLASAVAQYTARADRLPRGPRGHHVRAWYELRIRAVPACEVAEHLGPKPRERPSTALIWKWAERGRALVVRLAASDDDAARAELMRRVADAKPAPPDGPVPPQRPCAECDRHQKLFFYAFVAGLSARKSPEALLGVRAFARAVGGEGPLDPMARGGAEFVAKLATDDPIPERGRVVGSIARRLLASTVGCQRQDGAIVSPA